MDEDYLPPKEAEDVSLSTVNLQELLEPACPRCSDVRKSKMDMYNYDSLQRQVKKTDHNLITCAKCHFKFCFRCKEACWGQWHFSSEYGCPAYSKLAQDIIYFNTLTSSEGDTKDNNIEDNTELQ